MPIRLYFLTLLLAVPVIASAQIKVVAGASPVSVAVGQALTYTVEVQGSIDFTSIKLGASEAFRLQSNQISQSQSVTVINGQASQSKAYSYMFVAVKEGTHTLAPASVTIGGKTYSSNAVQVSVTKQAAGNGSASGATGTGGAGNGGASGNAITVAKDVIFVRPVVSKTALVVGEPATVTYKLYTKIPPASFDIKQDITSEGFWIEKFDVSHAYAQNEVINGDYYRVFILRKMQVFPTKAGQLEISPFVATCEASQSAIKQSRGAMSLEDLLNPTLRLVELAVNAPAVKFDVAPLPEPKPESFTGAVGKYAFTASVDKRRVKTGEPISFKFEISGEGNINALSDITLNLPQTFEQYPPKSDKQVQRTGNTVTGKRTEEVVVIPRASGKFELPAIAFSYYDPEQKKYITQKSEPVLLEIEQGAEGTTAFALPDKSGLSGGAASDIRGIKTNTNTLAPPPVPLYRSPLFYSAFLLPVAALVFFLFQKQQQDKLDGDAGYKRSYIATPEAKKRLKAAKEFLRQAQASGAGQKEFFTEIESAIIHFIGNKFNTDDRALTKPEIRAYLESKKLGSAAVDRCIEILEKSDLARFAPMMETKDDLEALYADSEKIISEISKL